MKLSYVELLGDGTRKTVDAKVTTDHPASSYGQPVIVLKDGDALDIVSWVGLNYRIEEANEEEQKLLSRVLIIDPDILEAYINTKH